MIDLEAIRERVGQLHGRRPDARHRSQCENDRAALLAEVDRLAEENTALQQRCDRLTSGTDIESDRLTAVDDRLVNALAERDEALAAVESLVCELPGGSIPADVAKALAHGRSIVEERDEARAKSARLQGELIDRGMRDRSMADALEAERAKVAKLREVVEEAVPFVWYIREHDRDKCHATIGGECDNECQPVCAWLEKARGDLLK